jgi:hypothetical protein
MVRRGLAGSRRPSHRSTPLRPLLAGGDRRSIAQSDRVRALVRLEPDRVEELARLAEDREWLVSMRALDLLEKIAHERADLVQPYSRLFIGPLADSDKWEIHLQIVRALPLLEWTRPQLDRVHQILERDMNHPQKFVRTWALDSLACFAKRDASLLPIVVRGLQAFERSGSKALATRARHIRARLTA